jgi:hypothetical protein
VSAWWNGQTMLTLFIISARQRLQSLLGLLSLTHLHWGEESPSGWIRYWIRFLYFRSKCRSSILGANVENRSIEVVILSGFGTGFRSSVFME